MTNQSIDLEHLDSIGPWTERKHDIVQYYAQAYSNILDRGRAVGSAKFHPYYIDGFAAAGYAIRRGTGDIVKGSALRVFDVRPEFEKYFLVERNEGRYRDLKQHCTARRNVHLFNGDANMVLVTDVFPQVRFDHYERAFCLLDPYNETHLRWQTIEAASATQAIDVLINFPVGSINRSVLRKDGKYTLESAERLTNIWGDRTWEQSAYSNEGSLFPDLRHKVDNDKFVEAFRRRLESVAGFKGTSKPIPMKNSSNAVIYFLIFASNSDKGVRVINQVANRFIRASRPQLTSRPRRQEVS